MKRIRLNDGELLALERNVLKHNGIPKYVVEYYAVPSDNTEVLLCHSKSNRQDYRWMLVLWAEETGANGEEVLSQVVEKQKNIERLLKNKGVDEVLCLFWNDVFVFPNDGAWVADAEFFMLGVKSL